jgi:hypothetical protein
MRLFLGDRGCSRMWSDRTNPVMVRSNQYGEEGSEIAVGRVVVLILGMVLLVLGAQGGIRLLVHHDDAGVLGWLPGGFAAQLSCFVVVTLAGLALAAAGGANARR